VVDEPQIVAVTGPNGGGKSTLLRCIATLQGFLGEIEVLGNVLGSRRGIAGALAMSGFVPQADSLDLGLRVGGAIEYAAWLKGVPRAARAERVRQALEALDLVVHQDKQIRKLSGGTRQRVAIAQAVVHDPRLLILDEPTTGVDAEHRVELRNLLRHISTNRFVVMSTHLTEDLELLADRVLVLADGTIRFDGPPADLMAKATVEDNGTSRPIERGLKQVLE
jgi:ABC-2 type transport system ATP-binding protein